MRPTAQRRHQPRSINHVTVAAHRWRARPVRARAPHCPGHTAPDRPVLHATGPASPSTINRADPVACVLSRRSPSLSVISPFGVAGAASGLEGRGGRGALSMRRHGRGAKISLYRAHTRCGNRAPGLHVAGHRPPGSARRRTATSATRLPPISRAALRTSRKVPIMQRESKADREACIAGRRRAAPDARPARTPAAAFPLVSAIPGNGLRSRERRFESCRGHW